MGTKIIVFLVAISVAIAAADPVPEPRKLKNTADRIRKYNYPVEEHNVQTADGYILKMFRIPYSPKLQNENVQKPVVFLQHGFLSLSDCWIFNGPDNAIAYMLVDAGYDVWMGNARGNTYSKKHVRMSPLLPKFWKFSWNEIGQYDLPAMIDYILSLTNEEKLHYVGHSQGTTVFLVMLSSIPRYNEKIKTSHLLAPVGFMEHMKSPVGTIGGPLVGNPSLLSALLGNNEMLANNKLKSLLNQQYCNDKSPFQDICGNMLFLLAGWDSTHLNYTLLGDVMETHPAGSSSSQLIHYLQEYNSGYFRQYDHGRLGNKRVYGQVTPPEYEIDNIKPEVPLEFYYSDNDYLAATVDVEHMAERLGKNVNLYHVEYPEWNHLDFVLALDVKEIINDRLLGLINKYENRTESDFPKA